jgi:hypothetical protein
MVEAALDKAKVSPSFLDRKPRMRLIIEAAIGAWVKPARAESARARWAAMTPEQRKQHTAPARKARVEKLGY